MPNPFYQIYEGAALLAGAEPRFLPCRPRHGFIPDFDGGGRGHLATLPVALSLLAGQPERGRASTWRP